MKKVIGEFTHFWRWTDISKAERKVLDAMEFYANQFKGVDAKEFCESCAAKKVYIRGRYPKEPQRLICPCCAVEKLEWIEDQKNNQTAKNG